MFGASVLTLSKYFKIHLKSRILPASRLFVPWMRKGNELNWQSYRVVRNVFNFFFVPLGHLSRSSLTCEVRNAIIKRGRTLKIFENAVHSNANNTAGRDKKFWNLMKQQSDYSGIPPIGESGKYHVTPTGKAEAINTYFCSVYTHKQRIESLAVHEWNSVTTYRP